MIHRLEYLLSSYNLIDLRKKVPDELSCSIRKMGFHGSEWKQAFVKRSSSYRYHMILTNRSDLPHLRKSVSYYQQL